MEYKDIGMCFVCGEKNERGLKLSFEFNKEKKRIKTIFKPQEWQQGFGGIIHGGFLATLLDEVMVKLAYCVGIPAVTAEMSIRFIEPTRIDKDIIVTGEIIRETKRIIYTKADAKYRDPSLRSGSPSPEERSDEGRSDEGRSDEGREGNIVAEAEGKLVKVGQGSAFKKGG